MTSFPHLRSEPVASPTPLVQEGTGFHLGIASDLAATGDQAVATIKARYDAWRYIGRHQADSTFKQKHFTIAVGGGNTVKAVYRALLEKHALDINWLDDVRFFFLDESSGERNWISATESLITSFISPLANLLVRHQSLKRLRKQLQLDNALGADDIAEHMVRNMVIPISMAEVKSSRRSNDASVTMELAAAEAMRYQQLLRKHLGRGMSFHLIITGIGRDGCLGAFSPYTPALKEKKPKVTLVEKENGAVRIALNRGIIVRAECIALIISGSLKLKALGRFEMEENTGFEQTVMETPVRMLRESYAIAEKVFIFADDQALHFKEGVFRYRENGRVISTNAEVREGSESDGIHIFLLHGFMGLYSYINFLIRLPSAWTVSALHRGKYAKKLAPELIFPHYATSLRKAILKNWRNDRPTPVGCHSIAGVISDHLLLSIIEGHDGELPEYDELKKEDQKLVEALRCGGLIHMATWAPSDIVHIGQNTDTLQAHLRKKTELDYEGPQQVYHHIPDGRMTLVDPQAILANQPGRLIKFAKLPIVEHVINASNRLVRYLLENNNLQGRVSRRETPYGMRVVGTRLLKKVSFYGLLKEISASLHDPLQYQERHLRALEIIVKYDIPSLTIIHRDDFMVSANRHREEHDFLLQARLLKENVKQEKDLQVATRFLLLEREAPELPADPLNPHLMLMSTSHEGDALSRQVTAAITNFVNENVAAAMQKGSTDSLASVKKWHADKRKPRARGAQPKEKTRQRRRA